MALLDLILKIIQSKWFILALGIGMAFLIPYTWHNVSIAPGSWSILLVFVVNILTVFLCCYNFFVRLGKKKSAPVQQSW